METVLATASQKQKWVTKYFSEYVRGSKYAPYMGRTPTSIIITKYELQEEAGKTINIPLITRLKGQGVSGSQVLDGNEEELGNYNFPISVDWRRHGVRVPKSTSYKTEIDLLNAARDMLKEWESEKLRDDVIVAMHCVIPAVGTTTPVRYGTITEATAGGYEILAVNYVASEADKDAYLALNSDRVLFGALRSNIASNDHSAALANIDNTADKLTPLVAELGKRMAKQASPHIRPYKTKGGAEFFVLFCNSRCFRDVKNDTSMTAANRDARPRDVDSNPIFQDGDLIKDGIIYREVEEQPILTAAGAGSIDVAANFLCGAQAVGIAWGQEPTPQTDRDKDYKFRPGVAIEELLGVEKIAFNGKQHGMVTIYAAAVADT
jgi:N4-gp56 family major capsid protein